MISTLPLRVIAIIAGIPVILLRAWMDPRTVFLTLLFYLTPYLFIAFAPRRSNATQTGFAVGFSISMQIAFLVLLTFSLGFNPPGPASAPPTPTIFFKALMYTNAALAVVGIIVWVWNRKSINLFTAASMFMFGLAYPFVAFVLEFSIASAIYH